MATASGLIDDAIAAFDCSRATALSLLNERYARMVVEARWLTKEATLTTTVAGTDAYAVTTTIENIDRVEVGGERFYPVDMDTFRDIADTEESDTDGNVFAEDYDASGLLYIRLYPAPDATGDNIVLISSGQPTALTDTTNAAGTPSFSTDLHAYLRDGLWADLYVYVDKNIASAQAHEQRFMEGVERLRRRRRSRTAHGRRMGVSVAGRLSEG